MIDIKSLLVACGPVKRDDGFLIAASGGMDSTVLCDLCHRAGLKIELAHCNFGLREAESERDEQFVKTFAAQRKIPFHSKKFNTVAFAEEKKISIQEAARMLRYDWFEQLLITQSHLKWVLTAHHQEDDAETIAMNFFRGTGLKGLMGIPAISGNILRPLLSVSQLELRTYATDHGINFVTDSSNLKEDYTRNYFRHTIIPAVEKVFPSTTSNLIDNKLRVQQSNELMQYFMDQFRQKYLLKVGEEFQISIAQLVKFEKTSLLYEILLPFGFSAGQTKEAALLLHARTGAQLEAVGGEWRLIRNRKMLILSPSLAKHYNYYSITQSDCELNFVDGILLIDQLKKENCKVGNEELACLDLRKLEFPLTLRKWREGDYFYPLGMPKKKKISRFLIDLKLSLTQKEKVWVLTSGDKICWVVGHRIDDRFKLTSNSETVFQLKKSSTLL